MKRLFVLLFCVIICSANIIAQQNEIAIKDSVSKDSITYYLLLNGITVFGKNHHELFDKEKMRAMARASGKQGTGMSFDFSKAITNAVNFIPFSIMRKFHIPFNDKKLHLQKAKQIVKEYDDIDVMQRNHELRKQKELQKQKASR